MSARPSLVFVSEGHVSTQWVPTAASVRRDRPGTPRQTPVKVDISHMHTCHLSQLSTQLSKCKWCISKLSCTFRVILQHLKIEHHFVIGILLRYLWLFPSREIQFYALLDMISFRQEVLVITYMLNIDIKI